MIGAVVLMSTICLKAKGTSLNYPEVRNLFWLGKVWGFLKYHSPEVAQGKLNWDSVLFTSLDLEQNSEPGKNVGIHYLIKTAQADREVPGKLSKVDPADSILMWIQDTAALDVSVAQH